ncbi:MAG: hypothetical protein CVU12_06770 [Bacteroidetes bacterium HGW-Bacteroidetes-7]|jgi:hypothetical protein|nr:MAG: hypothetical protein CVU12_06770 [Bacteroidetes bacterium HGW-Bacteroidetes-7]
MTYKYKIFSLLIALLIFSPAFSQNNPPPQKSPVEIAAEQADRLQIDLKLNDYQTFLADSILQANIAGVTEEFERMRAGGMQNPDSYREVQNKWRTKTEDAFEKFMTFEQFDRYLRISGVSTKERKKRLEKKEGAK